METVYLVNVGGILPLPMYLNHEDTILDQPHVRRFSNDCLQLVEYGSVSAEFLSWLKLVGGHLSEKLTITSSF